MNNLTPKITTNTKFEPPQETLPPLNTLLEIANTSADDIEHIKQRWQFKPPIEEFTNLLESS